MKRLLRFYLNLKLWLSGRYKTVQVQDELPKRLRKKRLYILEEDDFQWQASMLCPCGCGRTLHMNLLKEDIPFWTCQIHTDGSASLNPSVWRKTDCESHFWFRRGRVIWAGR